MARQFYNSFSSFRGNLDRFAYIARSFGFPSFLPIVTARGQDLRAPSPSQTQLALTCLQIALARLWMSWNIKPALVIGHSLGEYAALCIAGVLSVSDTIYLVGTRAQLLEERCTKDSHAMLAVRASPEQISELLYDEPVEVACRNGPTDTVLSGQQSHIQLVERSLREQGIKCTLVKVSFAFHSAQVDPILEDFRRAAQGVRFREPTISVLSPLRARAETHFDDEYLRDHCRQAVDFEGVLQAAQRTHAIQKGHMVLEIGPQPVLSGMFKSTFGNEVPTLPSLAQGQDSWKVTTTSLASLYQSGHDINWVEYNRDFRHRVVELPHYAWDLQHYWIDYVHDWSLRKGDPLPTAPLQPTPVLELPMSTTIHKASPYAMLRESGQIVIESDICRADLAQVVHGHEVDGFPLCTPSVYADIGLAVGRHLAQTHNTTVAHKIVNIEKMNITKALIARVKGLQILRTTVQYDAVEKVASCKFESLTDTGSVHGEHATCSIGFLDKSELEVDAAGTQLKINALRQGLLDNTAYQFNRSMIYKCIGALANFDPKYRGLLSVTMNSASFEAHSTVEFSGVSLDGSFHTHPALIDALSQVGGFVMNCNDRSDLNKEVFVDHGWGALYMFEPISATETYHTHVKMREAPGKLWKGDITVLKGEEVVAKFCGIALQSVPRRLLKMVLASDEGKTTIEQPANAHYPASSTPKTAYMPSQATKSTQPSSNILAAKFMDIISEESGLAIDDLGDDVSLTELGVDSLMSLLIVSRIHDELEIDIDHNAFADMGTVGGMKAYIEGPSSSGSSCSQGSSTPYDGSQTTIDTPPRSALDGEPELFGHKRPSNPAHVDGTHGAHIVGHRHSIPNGALFPCGTEDSDASIAASQPSAGPRPPRRVHTTSPDRLHSGSEASTEVVETSVVVQGTVRTAERILFLLPDGSGSAHSYVDVPNVRRSLAIVGLNCPFRTDAAAMKHTSLDILTKSYVTEIRRRQSHGPFHLGGWSAGGILAYCVTQMLIGEGEEVANLLLIDSPAPTGLSHLPQRFYDHCQSTGLFCAKMPGSNGTPAWLLPHFEATIDLLHEYFAEPLLSSRMPKTSIIWAADCVFDGVDFELLPKAGLNEEEGEAVKFLTEKRVNVTAGAWARLFPGGQVSVTVAEGTHHFSLMVSFPIAGRTCETHRRADRPVQHDKAGVLADFIDASLLP